MPRSLSPATDKDKILKRLTRAEGQIRGISRLVAKDTYCIDVLTQIAAAEAALDKVALELLRGHAVHCLQTDETQGKAPRGVRNTENAQGHDKKADELVNAISRLLSR